MASDQPVKMPPAGGGTWKRTDPVAAEGAGALSSSAATARQAAITATAHGSHVARQAAAAGCGLACDTSVSPSSSSFTSCADWSRSSGSLTRHARTTRSRMAGSRGAAT